MSAANFTILGRIIERLGYRYSWLTPTWCKRLVTLLLRANSLSDLIVFLTLDTASLIVQAIGGASASRAAETGGDPEPGGNIMLYGIVTQISTSTFLVISCCSSKISHFGHLRGFGHRLSRPVPSRQTRAQVDLEEGCSVIGVGWRLLVVDDSGPSRAQRQAHGSRPYSQHGVPAHTRRIQVRTHSDL